jgi:ribosomal protein S18 acetylase RimI-like enzyme
VIRAATAGDAEAIATIHVRSWRDAYRDLLSAELLDTLSIEARTARWLATITARTAEILVAELPATASEPRSTGAALIGFTTVAAAPDDGPSAAELGALYVDPSHVGRGAGRALWLAALERLRARAFITVGLWVFSANDRARRFYEAAGFAADPATVKQVQRGDRLVDQIRYRRPV